MRSVKLRRLLAGTAMLALVGAANGQADPLALPRIAALDTARFTVSGVSAGAAMAVQLGVAYSSRVAGVGIIAGPPYLCAEGSVLKAIFSCLILAPAQWDKWTSAAATGTRCATTPGKPLAVQSMIDHASDLAGRGAIDPPASIARQKVWEFRGRCDAVVGSNASAAHAAFYRHFGADFQSRTVEQVGHTMPTDKPGLGSCDGADKDFISSCNFDAVGVMLRHILSGAAEGGAPISGHWQRFDQTRHLGDGPDGVRRLEETGMAREGQVFVPAMCATQSCRLHVALHGCLQGLDDEIFESFVRQSGYAEWASRLGLVVLFPRVTGIRPFQRGFDPVANPAGCWDWWGYSNGESTDALRYASRDAPQMQAIIRMADALGAR